MAKKKRPGVDRADESSEDDEGEAMQRAYSLLNERKAGRAFMVKVARKEEEKEENGVFPDVSDFRTFEEFVKQLLTGEGGAGGDRDAKAIAVEDGAAKEIPGLLTDHKGGLAEESGGPLKEKGESLKPEGGEEREAVVGERKARKAYMIKRPGREERPSLPVEPWSPDSVPPLPEEIRKEAYVYPPENAIHPDDESDFSYNEEKQSGRCYGWSFGRDRCLRRREEATNPEAAQWARAAAAGLLTGDEMFCCNHQDNRERWHVEEEIRVQSRKWALMPCHLLIVEMRRKGLGDRVGRAVPAKMLEELTRQEAERKGLSWDRSFMPIIFTKEPGLIILKNGFAFFRGG